ncbi:MAG: tyrosine-type recombinase/integrase [Clostridia bacterium]|nr:tyrosine-type recombinase/integrase [Clostridia bacterium]
MNIEDALVFGERERDLIYAATTRSATPYRDRALIELFYHHGPTVRQALALEVGHVNFPAGRVYWPSEARECRLAPEALNALAKYVALERNPRCPALFTTRLGHPLTPRQVTALFRRLRDVTGLPITPFTLRMGSLYRWLEEQPVEAVAGLLIARRRERGPRILRS